MLEVVRTAWTMHAAGEDYAAIGRYLGAHAVPRRGTAVPPGSTFADLLTRPGEIGNSAKSLFVNAARSPHTERELYLCKVTLMETGTWPYRVANDIAQRGVTVAGLVPTYRDEHDSKGVVRPQPRLGMAPGPVHRGGGGPVGPEHRATRSLPRTAPG